MHHFTFNSVFSTITATIYKQINITEMPRYSSNCEKNISVVQPSSGSKNSAKKLEVPMPSLLLV